jgi:hypothetical protein
LVCLPKSLAKPILSGIDLRVTPAFFGVFFVAGLDIGLPFPKVKRAAVFAALNLFPAGGCDAHQCSVVIPGCGATGIPGKFRSG